MPRFHLGRSPPPSWAPTSSLFSTPGPLHRLSFVEFIHSNSMGGRSGEGCQRPFCSPSTCRVGSSVDLRGCKWVMTASFRKDALPPESTDPSISLSPPAPSPAPPSSASPSRAQPHPPRDALLGIRANAVLFPGTLPPLGRHKHLHASIVTSGKDLIFLHLPFLLHPISVFGNCEQITIQLMFLWWAPFRHTRKV